MIQKNVKKDAEIEYLNEKKNRYVLMNRMNGYDVIESVQQEEYEETSRKG